MTVICDYCEKPAKFTTGAEVYPHRKDLHGLKYWYCKPCNAYVGCHKRNPRLKFNGDEPLGRLANSELRRAKMQAHAAFDPLWKDGVFMSRGTAYGWLAWQMNLTAEKCHIGMFDVEQCMRVVALAKTKRAEALGIL